MHVAKTRPRLIPSFLSLPQLPNFPWVPLSLRPLVSQNGFGIGKASLAACKTYKCLMMQLEDLGAPLSFSSTCVQGRILYITEVTRIFLISGCRHLAFLGATILILTQFFDPFLQQVVIYPDRLVASDAIPIIVRTDRYQAGSLEGLPLPSIVDLPMKAAIYRGIFDVRDSAEYDLLHTCSTDNCTWSAFTSLAVCNKCVDITSEIKKNCDETGSCVFSLPNGPMLSGYSGQINSSVTNISLPLMKIQPSVVKFSSLRSKKSDESSYASAMECALWYCYNTYTATVVGGRLKQEVHSSWRNDSALPSQSSDLIYQPSPPLTNPTANSSVFRVTHSAARSVNEFMTSLFTGSGGVKVSGATFTSDISQALYKTDNLTKLIENLATSMTNNIRQQNDSVSNPQWKGTSWTSQTYVHVRWAWFAFPATLVSLSLALLLGTIIETRYRDIVVWKSNNLALLFHGCGLQLNNPDDTPVNKLSHMSEKAKGIRVELMQTSNKAWNFVQNR